MPARKGQTKAGGRKKGTPNKRTLALFGDAMDVLRGIGFNPLQRMAEVAKDPKSPPDLQFRACAELAKYVYPQRKAIDVTSNTEQPASKVEYGWVPRKSSEGLNTTPSQAKPDSTNAGLDSKGSVVQ